MLLFYKKNSNFSDDQVRNERLESIKNNSFYEKIVWSECAGVAVLKKIS